jgi:hypothetical protein
MAAEMFNTYSEKRSGRSGNFKAEKSLDSLIILSDRKSKQKTSKTFTKNKTDTNNQLT